MLYLSILVQSAEVLTLGCGPQQAPGNNTAIVGLVVGYVLQHTPNVRQSTVDGTPVNNG